jgi:hypothetical protein
MTGLSKRRGHPVEWRVRNQRRDEMRPCPSPVLKTRRSRVKTDVIERNAYLGWELDI